MSIVKISIDGTNSFYFTIQPGLLALLFYNCIALFVVKLKTFHVLIQPVIFTYDRYQFSGEKFILGDLQSSIRFRDSLISHFHRLKLISGCPSGIFLVAINQFLFCIRVS